MSAIRIGVSRCLLGEAVRYDGGSKPDYWLIHRLGPLVQWVKVCPEVESGMGVPREAMRLEMPEEDPHLMTARSRRDLSMQMRAWIEPTLETLAGQELTGYVLKSRSPSCGMSRVKVYQADGAIHSVAGAGLFAAALKARFPLLPIEEEGRLQDEFLRESFLDRIFARQRWSELLLRPLNATRLTVFHRAHKLALMAHAPGRYAELGRLAAGNCTPEVGEAYYTLLMELLAEPATVGRHCNVLMHALGYFKEDLADWEKMELLDAIEHFRNGLVNRAVPMTLLRHYARKYEKQWLLEQTLWQSLTPVYLG